MKTKLIAIGISAPAHDTTNWLPYTNFTGNGSLRQMSIVKTNAQRFFRVSEQ